MHSGSDLEATLLALAPALRSARRPWWVIASAAVQLYVTEDLAIRDVDVLIDPLDVPEVFAALDLRVEPGGGEGRFRSAWFARYDELDLPVELFAGFELLERGTWNTIVPASRVLLRCGQAEAYVPDTAELGEMLRRFGRPKDLARAAVLSASGPFPSRS